MCEEACPLGIAFRAQSLCFVLIAQDVSSQLHVLATHCYAIPATIDSNPLCL